LVLANPPFKGSLVETATNGKILSIAKTKKTEMLFVALMIMLLKPGGRCMTIVPDGVLENNNEKAYDTLRHELVDKHKLVAVISLPQSLFKAPTKKGSSSKGASIKTSFIIFQKTDKGGTDKVWFYDMKNDGFSLDAKRVEVEENDIPDVIKRFNNLSNEKDRTRNDKSFFVSLEDIKSNNYSLSINTYKEKADEKYEHRKNDDILNELNDLIALEKTLLTLIGGK
jgi:type I restriction enzyme M protein